MRRRIASTLVLVLALGVSSLSAQWPNRITPGVPRTPDGKVNLTAPAPRLADGKVDFSGVWHIKASPKSYQTNIAIDLSAVPMQPEAEKLYTQRKATQGRQHPRVQCLPRGIPNAMLWAGGPFKFVHTPGVTFILFEEFVTYRQVFTDGRPLPDDPQPAWWGYSIGHWDSDTFVIESSGFREDTWLDFDGHVATEGMKITERYRRLNFGELEAQFTFDDPKAYTRPWSVTIRFDLMPDTEFIEHVCENEFTSQRLSGK